MVHLNPVGGWSLADCDCRAYKLGKGRWSYNQCELILQQQAAEQDASRKGVRVTEAIHINSRVTLPACGHQVCIRPSLSSVLLK